MRRRSGPDDGRTETDRSHIAAQRMRAQNLSKPCAGEPLEIVGAFGAVQAQEYYPSLWALGLRLENATEAEVEEAVETGRIVRTWALRGTIHYVLPQDAAWMVREIGSRVVSKMQAIYRRAEIDEATIDRSATIAERTLAGGRRLTRPEFYAALEDAGVSTASPRGMHLVVRLALRGLICFGPRKGRQPTITLLDEWAGRGRDLARDEATAELALRYFQSHGPATVHDFAWWSRVGVTESRRALEAIGGRLETETIAGTRYFVAPGASEGRSNSCAHLLPIYDEYTVAYKDRDAAIADRYLETSLNGLGPNIVHAGRVIGTWKRPAGDTVRAGTATVEISTFDPRDETESAAIGAAIDRYARFLGREINVRTFEGDR